MYLLFVGCLLAAMAGPSAEAASQVPVTVYYESLCPDSIKFYINQLYPNMENAHLSTNVDLHLVPYGKSTHSKAENGSWVFTCHHGEAECYGNKVQACALQLMTSQNERLTYLNCLLKSVLEDRKIVYPVEKCAEKLSIAEKTDILKCANSTTGEDYLAAMGDRTNLLQPKLTSVPTVVFNNKYDQNDQKMALTNFKGVLCKYLSSPKPAECSGTSGVSTSVFVLSAALALVFSQYF